MSRGLRAALAGALALGVALTTPRPALAESPGGTMPYKVKAGDTLELIAAEYYGDRNDAVFIMVENHILHPRALKAGELIKIPVSREVTTSPGDTLETLAAAYLGDARRGPFLAEFNGMASADGLAGGATLSIPFHVTHTAADEESIASIAAAYFGDSKNADMLKRYNFLDKTALAKGESIVVPIFHVRVRASKLPPPDADARTRAERRRINSERAAAALPGAREAWRSGDFAAVKRELTGLDLDYLDTVVAVDIGVLLGASYVAYDDVDSALATFKRALERKPHHALDPYEVSPKILEVWRRAGGHVGGGARPAAPR
jgi:LysM repeat protein